MLVGDGRASDFIFHANVYEINHECAKASDYGGCSGDSGGRREFQIEVRAL